MKFLIPLYKINKYRKGLGLIDALKVYASLFIQKKGKIKLRKFPFPFYLRPGNDADSSTFNEVILRNEYSISLPFNPKRIIDCGANIGLASIIFANKFNHAKIIAIEPEEENYTYLIRNTEPYKNIVSKKAAVWSKPAELKIANLSVPSNAFSIEASDEPSIQSISSITIPDIMKENHWHYIDLVKIDIEGAEKELFTSNYEDWLPKVNVLIIETHDKLMKGSSHAVFQAISRYSFSCAIKGFNFVFTNDHFHQID
jgi:FkbM family methyltransferase